MTDTYRDNPFPWVVVGLVAAGVAIAGTGYAVVKVSDAVSEGATGATETIGRGLRTAIVVSSLAGGWWLVSRAFD